MDLEKLLNTSDETLISRISSTAIHRVVDENHLVVDIGEKMPGVPLLISGMLRVYRADQDQEYFLYHIEPGEICAMAIQCCLSHKKSNIRIYADRKSEILFIPAEEGTELMNDHPDWSKFILRSVTDKFTRLAYNIDGLAFENLETRLQAYLTEKSEAFRTKSLNLTHTEIARDLNSSREVISRNLKSLQLKGIIKKEAGSILVL